MVMEYLLGVKEEEFLVGRNLWSINEYTYPRKVTQHSIN